MVQRDTVKESDVETSVYFNNSSYGTLTNILRKIYISNKKIELPQLWSDSRKHKIYV